MFARVESCTPAINFAVRWIERRGDWRSARGTAWLGRTRSWAGAAALLVLGGCVTVRPEQRAVLADPIMQFQGDARESAQLQHILENREGSFGGASVKGGGCGCN